MSYEIVQPKLGHEPGEFNHNDGKTTYMPVIHFYLNVNDEETLEKLELWRAVALTDLSYGYETVVHEHSNKIGASHAHCEAYVLVWREEFADMTQIQRGGGNGNTTTTGEG